MPDARVFAQLPIERDGLGGRFGAIVAAQPFAQRLEAAMKRAVVAELMVEAQRKPRGVLVAGVEAEDFRHQVERGARSRLVRHRAAASTTRSKVRDGSCPRSILSHVSNSRSAPSRSVNSPGSLRSSKPCSRVQPPRRRERVERLGGDDGRVGQVQEERVRGAVGELRADAADRLGERRLRRRRSQRRDDDRLDQGPGVDELAVAAVDDPVDDRLGDREPGPLVGERALRRARRGCRG